MGKKRDVFKGYKVRMKDGTYQLVKTGIDSVNKCVGYVNGRPLGVSFTQLEIEALKEEDKKSEAC